MCVNFHSEPSCLADERDFSTLVLGVKCVKAIKSLAFLRHRCLSFLEKYSCSKSFNQDVFVNLTN